NSLYMSSGSSAVICFVNVGVSMKSMNDYTPLGDSCKESEAERRVPRLELLRALEEADDIAILGIRGHPVPGFRREGWRVGFDDRMEPLPHAAIRLRQRGDLREHGAFAVRVFRAPSAARVRLQLLEALPHRDSF